VTAGRQQFNHAVSDGWGLSPTRKRVTSVSSVNEPLSDENNELPEKGNIELTFKELQNIASGV